MLRVLDRLATTHKLTLEISEMLQLYALYEATMT